MDEDVYDKMCDKLNAVFAETCKKVSASSKLFNISKSNDGIWVDDPYMFAYMDIEFKKDVSGIDKNTLVTELEKLIKNISNEGYCLKTHENVQKWLFNKLDKDNNFEYVKVKDVLNISSASFI